MGLGFIGGLISGAEDNTTTQTTRREVADQTNFEKRIREQQQSLFDQINQLSQATGLGASDVQAAVSSQKDLANMLQKMSESSGLPSISDIKQSRALTSELFAPERTALAQSFEDQETAFRRRAALSGREVNDPILAAKLAQDQTRQQAMLSARQGAAAQNLAFQLPGQRLQYAQGRADILGQLANQAFQTRASLIAQGGQLAEADRARRLDTQTTTQTNVREGSLGQALVGGAAGMAQDIQTASSIASMASGMPSFGGGAPKAAVGGGAGAAASFAPASIPAPMGAGTAASTGYIPSNIPMNIAAPQSGPGYYNSFGVNLNAPVTSQSQAGMPAFARPLSGRYF